MTYLLRGSFYGIKEQLPKLTLLDAEAPGIVLTTDLIKRGNMQQKKEKKYEWDKWKC